MSVYASGSKNLSYENGHLTTPNVKWLGIRPSDITKFDIPKDVRIQMTPNDIKMTENLLKDECVNSKPEWANELRTMLEMKENVEIQALTCFGMNYLTEVYLPKKLQDFDFV
ncbi:unnamed protein product [Lactuca saligna]|uniref:Topoisomerase 6 subunit A/Spo11 TOPRIM domain-containing protein n=1 Tax=Lactuca saligna TaxID=75948 RepID=A0AA35YDT0_LACSI|nr:unnamed protein product [Lactuca saligna]